MTEASLKPDWTKVKFGEVVRLCKDRSSDPEADGIERYVGLEHLEPEDLRIRSWGLVAEGTTFTSRFKPGQVLFGKRRAYQRKVAVAEFKGVCSGDIYIFESADPKHLLPELLPFICQTDRFFEYAVGTSAGSLSPRTNWKSLQNFDLLLPPLKDQKEILTAVLSFEESLENLHYLIQSSCQLLESSSKKVFGEILNDPSIPKKKLEELLEIPVSNGIFRKKETFGSGMPLVNVTDIYEAFKVSINALDRVPVSPNEYERYSAKANDVIFNRSSLVLSGIGHACLIPEITEKAVFECHLMRARPDKNIMLGEFLTRYSLSVFGRQHFLSRAQTTTMTTISQPDLNCLIVPLPKLTTQNEIASYLDQIEACSLISLARKKQLKNTKKRLVDRILRSS